MEKKNINLTSIIKIQEKLTLNYTIQTQSQTNIISKLETQPQVNQNNFNQNLKIRKKMRILRPKWHTRNDTKAFRPVFPEQTGIKTETKMTLFYLEFFNGTECSGWNKMVLTTLSKRDR